MTSTLESVWKPVAYRDGTLCDLVLQCAEKHPDYTAYEFMGKKTKYRAFAEQIGQAARALASLGVREDEIVCIAMPNVPQAIIFFYAVNRIGAVANIIHPLSSEQELLMFLNRVRAKTVLIMDQFYGNLRSIRDRTAVENVIVADVGEALPAFKKLPYALTAGRKIPKIGKNEKILRFRDFMKLGVGKPALPAQGDRTDKTAVILHSGGTTGKIKGVCLSNRSVNASALQMFAAADLREKDRMLSVMPIFHGNGLVIGVHLILISGGDCVLIPRFTPKTYAEELLKHQCNFMSGVPTLLEKLMEVPAMQKADLSFLKGVFSGADSLSVDLQRRINAFLKEHHAPITVRQGYGMTEGVVATTLNPDSPQKEGSIGLPLADVTVKIIRTGTTEELPRNEIGEITFSSCTNMLGYYEDEEETSLVMKVHPDGKTYIHSGDLGLMDEDGFVYFKGRIKRMIVTNGYNVFPSDLENIIESHPSVNRCCVLGVPDPDRIERVIVFIVPQHGTEPNEETKKELLAFFRKNIARYAIPREILFVDDLPRTKVGKVSFGELLERYEAMKKNGSEAKK